MKPIDILGLKNFRIFDDKEGFFAELSSINLLTGANNAGKSSVTKALQMVRNSLKGNVFPFDLDLSEQEHLLGDFDNLLYDKDNRNINVCLPFTFLGLTKLYISLTFRISDDDKFKAKLRRIDVQDHYDKKILFSFNYREATDEEKVKHEQNYNKQWEEFKKKDKIAEDKRKKLEAKGEAFDVFSMGIDFMFPPINNPLDSYIDWKINQGKLRNYLTQLLDIYTDYLKHNRSFEWLDQRDKYADEIAIPFIPSTFVNSFKGSVNLDTWQNFLDKHMIEDLKTGKYAVGDRDFEVDDIFDAKLSIEHVFYNGCLSILKNELRWLEKENGNKHYSYDVIANCFQTSWQGLSNRISSIHYVSIIREQNSRGYSSISNTPFVNLLKDFAALKGKYGSFMKNYLKKFEIGANINVRHLISYQLMTVSVESDPDLKTGKKISRELVDFGSGIKQLLLILMQITVLSKKNKLDRQIYDYRDGEVIRTEYSPSILVVEEPETNLHPKWQSLLAEMFVEASTKFNIQLIIETHSEHLIHSFQNLVAETKLRSEKIKIFYLREKKHADKKRKQIEEIAFEKDGSIDYKAFDKGFFHVSEELELLRFNMKRQKFLAEFEELKKSKGDSEKVITGLEQKIDEFYSRENIDYFKTKVSSVIDIERLDEWTIKYMTSGQFLLEKLLEDDDFSTVMIQYGRALENEIKQLFLPISSTKKWMLGVMQGSLELAVLSRTDQQKICTAAQQRKLTNEVLPNYFADTENLNIENLNDLRDRRNSVAHAGGGKTRDEAVNYIEAVTIFLKNWILQKRC
ncbi:AAA family ATPase [uncultured Chryseobacterium sp.]|uniref:AAA family ATPase n=1 Tax=uncultured Chryseobacterium sp. TaxID=259322 RepID=UPI002589A313|nr:AAA family ATPase [uncultured Chryseobacterium sp.]